MSKVSTNISLDADLKKEGQAKICQGRETSGRKQHKT